MLLSGARIILRAQPGAALDKHRALLGGPLMRRGKPDGTKILSPMMAGGRAEADRHVRRPIGRGADLGNRAAGNLAEDREAGHVRDLALIGRHAERGVALQMLYR